MSNAAATHSDVSDVLEIDSLLSAGELAVRERVRDFADQRISPGITGWSEDAEFPLELAPELGNSACWACIWRATAAPGRSAVEYGLAAMELEAGDSGSARFVSVQGSLAMTAIHKWGSEDQKQEWLPPHGRRRADRRLCPDRTHRRFGPCLDADLRPPGRLRRGRRLDPGRRQTLDRARVEWPMFLVVWASTADGVRGFLVPAGTPGVTATPIGQKLSMRASIQCDITFDGVRLGPEALLPAAQGLAGTLHLPQRGPVRHRVGCDGRRPGFLRGRPRLRPGAAAVRQAAGRIPADAGETGEHAPGNPEGHPAGPAPGPAEGRRHAAPGADLARQAEQRAGRRSRLPGRPARSLAAMASPWTIPRCGTPPTWNPSAPTRAPTRFTPWSWASTSRGFPPSAKPGVAGFSNSGGSGGRFMRRVRRRSRRRP